MKPETITLGGTTFEIAPMNFAQLEEVEDAFAKLGEASPGRERSQAYQAIVLAGIQTTKPDFNLEALRKIPAISHQQVLEAANSIARVSGLAPTKDEKQGEALAASTSAGTI